MSGQRPAAAFLADDEDSRERILAVAQRLLTRGGSHATTLGEVAREAGVSPAGLRQHFGSRAQLLHAVLDTRDAYDDAHADRSGDILAELERAGRRFREVPGLAGLVAVLQGENLDPGDPLHERLRHRHGVAVDTVAAGIRRGQLAGRYRPDLDPAVKAAEIVAFLHGLESAWLLDQSIPVTGVFREYTRSLARQLDPA